VTADSGSAALSLFKRQSIQLVVSDLQMPGINGVELLTAVREHWPDTVRIVLSGTSDIHIVQRAINDGAIYQFFTKPVDNDELRIAIRLALAQIALKRENEELNRLVAEQRATIEEHVASQNHTALGYILDKYGLASRDKFDSALTRRRPDESIIEALVRQHVIPREKIVNALCDHLSIPFVDVTEATLDPEMVRSLPRVLCEANRILPVGLGNGCIELAMEDPSDLQKCDSIELMIGMKVRPLVAHGDAILHQLKACHGKGSVPFGLDYSSTDDLDRTNHTDDIDIFIADDKSDVDVEEMLQRADTPQIVAAVNAIIKTAVRQGASDIHVQPRRIETHIRYRIDGLLRLGTRLPKEFHLAIVSRLKILAKVDIAERRLPQDGRFAARIGQRHIDIRASFMPTVAGEKVVLRILDRTSSIRRLDELGFLDETRHLVSSFAKKPQGMIIATGPTGSGKTTVLYSLLSHMMEASRSFQTIEEPVEYLVEEAAQVNIFDKAGLSFGSALRSTLRQDPDVILVGEIRDQDTADVAFKAALTGHMVLSTLHTNYAVATITRLIDMGVKPYVLASALEGVFAQRLVRRICPHCQTEVPPSDTVLSMLGLTAEQVGGHVFAGRGCHYCDHLGYIGRTNIYEILAFNDDLRQLLNDGFSESEFTARARAAGLKSLLECGVEKVRLGKTTLAELLRVLGPSVTIERTCRTCSQRLTSDMKYCPFCGDSPIRSCGVCGAVLDLTWEHCPSCGHAADQLESSSRSRRRDETQS